MVRITICCLLMTFSFALLVQAEGDSVNVSELMNNAQKFYGQKSYYKAIEELEWALKELNNLHFQKIKTYLPEKVAGYTVNDSGGDAVGIKGLERTFTQESTKNTVRLNVVSGSSAGSAAGLGALMNMASWAAAFNPGNSVVMIKGRKGNLTINTDSKEVTLMFQLPKSAFLTITANGSTTGDEAKKFAELINFDSLEKEYE